MHINEIVHNMFYYTIVRNIKMRLYCKNLVVEVSV